MSKTNTLKLTYTLLPDISVEERDTPLDNIARLWSPTQNCEENFAQLVDLGQKLCALVFKGQVDWHHHIWDITGFEPTVMARGLAERSYVLVTQRSGL